MNIDLNSRQIKDENFKIPEWHQRIVLDRIKTFNKENLKSWDELKKQIQHK